MFACRACTRRVFNIFLENGLPPETRNVVRSSLAHRTRTYATAAVAVKESNKADEGRSRDDNDDESYHRVSRSTEWAVNKNLEYLKDPLFIARHVERTLARGNFEEAALLVRKASKKYKVAVSWNYLIEYQMRNLKLNAALKLYNEMKKRAQLPNAQTYTVIFNGCALSPYSKLAVAEAVKMYNNMMNSPEGRIKPNTIHLNAVLNVCARADDIDTMFAIVKSANESMRSPNNLTFTTIINALRAHVIKLSSNQREDPAVVEEATKQAIQRAKAIWDEVISKWRSAKIVVDEELVCAMGRVLLMGDWRDNASILDLVEQTMKIPKDERELMRLVGLAKRRDPPEMGGSKTGKSGSPALQKSSTDMSIKASPTHAKPGNNSLSLILASLVKTRKTTLGPRYWSVFIQNFSVVPDGGNYSSMLNVLRVGKNSGKTAEYLWGMPKTHMSPKTFRTAMGTCLADNLNKSAFNNATQVLEVMLTSLRVPDMAVLRIYLRVAYANKRLFEEQAKNDLEGAKLAWGKQLTIALDNLWGPYKVAAKQFEFGGLGRVPSKACLEEDELQRWIKEVEPRTELAALARKMVAAYDRIISEHMVPEEVSAKLKPRRNSLNHFVHKFLQDKDKFDPRFNHRVEALESDKGDEEDYKELHSGGIENW